MEKLERGPEQQECIPGLYDVKIVFKNSEGESIEVDMENGIEALEGEDWDVLEKKVSSYALAIGLHNYGMDVFKGRYPDGHPVSFLLKNIGDPLITHRATINFDGSGYPTERTN
jgi:hypothetical protein